MLAQQVEDYYKLHLYLETQRYIFRILSAKLIISNPRKYGFLLTPEDLYTPMDFDRIKINNSTDIPIRVIAEAAGTYFKRIKDLNPEIRGHHIPKGGRIIFVPKGTSEQFYRQYKKMVRTLQPKVKTEEGIYVVKKGDNLAAIAQRLGVPLKTLLQWNGLSQKKTIHPGQRLVVQPQKKAGAKTN